MDIRIPQERTSKHMTAAAYVERARHWAKMLEDRESFRTGEPIYEARKAVARRIAVPTGTLENLRKGRLKAIASHWYEHIRGGVISALESELRHVEFEIQIARQTGLDPRSSEAQSLLANYTRLRETLGIEE